MLAWNDVSKRFGGRLVVGPISLRAVPGEILGLLGPNGAGKTTLLHMAVGLLEPDGGTIEVAGRGSPRSPETRRALGVATQSLSLYDDLSGWEQLSFLAALYGVGDKRARKQIAWALALVGLTDRARDRVRTYSVGMKRRLNVASALVHDPEVVLLDEPTAGVDPQSRERIMENVESLRDLGRTVVYTTHHLEEAERLCDRVAIVDAGRLLAIGTLDELTREHDAAAPIAATRERAGGKLESLFLRLTGRSLRDD